MHQNFCSFLLKQSCLNIHKLFHSSGTHLGNHYETLKLPRNCTTKEIRESFIKLSKENHPDINKSPKAHKEFLNIQNAYNVLSKTSSRATYDLGLSNPAYTNESTINVDNHDSARYGERIRNPWDDPYFYHNRDRSQDAYYERQPYYGIRGINKVSNGTIAFVIVMIAAASFVFQMVLVNNSKNVRPWDEDYEEKSAKK